MTRRHQPEAQIQRAVVDHIAWRSVPNCFWFAVPLGGWRSKVEAAIFRGLGVTPGVPDLIIIYQGRCYGLERKSENGRLTPVQRDAHTRLRDAGAVVELCASPMLTKFGRKSKPHLKVIEWRNTGSENVEEISDRTESEHAMDDQLPW